jgi:hypothetical protein
MGVDIRHRFVEKHPSIPPTPFAIVYIPLQNMTRGFCLRPGRGLSVRTAKTISWLVFGRIVVACACLLHCSSAARAEFSIEGGVSALRVEATQAPIEEIFSAIRAIYGVNVTASALPEEPITGIYSGPLERVIAGMLNRYDYVLSVSPDAIDIVFLGARSGQVARVRVAGSGNRGLRPPVGREPK